MEALHLAHLQITTPGRLGRLEIYIFILFMPYQPDVDTRGAAQIKQSDGAACTAHVALALRCSAPLCPQALQTRGWRLKAR